MEANRRPTESAEPGASAPLEHASRAGLEQAFALFNQMSNQLSESYSLLEARVNELKGQLALVSAQRMQELAEKERLAHRLPAPAKPETTGVQLDAQFRDGSRSLQQRGGAVAPAAEGVVYIMQSRFVHVVHSFIRLKKPGPRAR